MYPMNKMESHNGYLALTVYAELAFVNINNAINNTEKSLELTQIDKNDKAADNIWQRHNNPIERNEAQLRRLTPIIIPNYKTICLVGATCKELNKKKKTLIKPIKSWYEKINTDRNNTLLAVLQNIVRDDEFATRRKLISNINLNSYISITNSDLLQKSVIYVHDTEHNPSVFQYPSLEDQLRIIIVISRPFFLKKMAKTIYASEQIETLFRGQLDHSRFVDKPLKNVFTIEDNNWLVYQNRCVEIKPGENDSETISILRKKYSVTSI